MVLLDSTQIPQNIQDGSKDTWQNGSQPEISIAFRKKTQSFSIWLGRVKIVISGEMRVIFSYKSKRLNVSSRA